MTAQPTDREAFCQAYPALWARLVDAWSTPAGPDCAWLTYSANYLLRTGSTRWAIDPYVPTGRVPGAPLVELSALERLDFVLLTHRHADHFHPTLIASLRHAPIQWVVPDSLLDDVRSAGIAADRITRPVASQAITLGEVRITPFDGLHVKDGRGVPALGYLAAFGGRRWLFPGDTRNYEAALLPDFGAVDGLFAHVWLGRRQAGPETPPLLEDFCRFCLDLQPKRVILAHLNDFGRADDDRWTARHAALARARLEALRPGLPVQAAFAGAAVLL